MMARMYIELKNAYCRKDIIYIEKDYDGGDCWGIEHCVRRSREILDMIKPNTQ